MVIELKKPGVPARAAFDDNLTQVHDILDTERIEGKIYSYTWKGASKRLVYKKLTNNMYLVLCAPASEIDVSRNSLAMQCLVILFVVLLIASIAGIHMVHRITKPLRGLTEAAKQVAGGDWNAKIEAGGQDEVGHGLVERRVVVERLNLQRVLDDGPLP